MKKLMIVAAVAMSAVVAQAKIALTNCHPVVSMDCPQIVFKVGASGKTVTVTDKDEYTYKSVASLKVTKGALVLFGTAAGDGCCYDTYSLYLNAKIGKATKKIALLQGDLEKWSVFGKNLEAAMDAEKSKKYSLESDLGIWWDDDADDYFGDELTGLQFFATAFGKATYKFVAGKDEKGSCGVCVPGQDTWDIVPGNYKGWFAGWFDLIEDGLCMNCQCSNNDIFGGTWTAKYNKSWSTKKLGWKSAAEYVFGGATAALMAEEEVE